MSSDTSSTSNVNSKPAIAIPKVEMMSMIDSTKVNDDDVTAIKEEPKKKSVSFGEGPSCHEISRDNTPVPEEVPKPTKKSDKEKSLSAPGANTNFKPGKENKGTLTTKTNDSQQTNPKQSEKLQTKRGNARRNSIHQERSVVEQTTVAQLVDSKPSPNVAPTSASLPKSSHQTPFVNHPTSLPPINSPDQDNFGSSVAKPKLTGDDLPKMADFLPDIRARIEELTRPKKKGKNSRQQSANANSDTIILGMLNPAGDNRA